MNPLLRPEVLNSISQLELTAKILAEGYMTGSSRSQSLGAGQVFSQYRNYESGDDVRQLDWKMYARSERYYIKQSDIETNITVKFMLDATRSMNYTEQNISKLQYAKILIAALAWLARKQGDATGLYAANAGMISMIQPRFEQQHFMRFLTALLAVEGDGGWIGDVKKSHLFDHHGKELIVFFTDLYDDQHDLQEFVSKLKTSRNEVIVFHLLGKNERTLDHQGVFTFEDLESGKRMEVNTATEKQTYALRVENWIAQSRNWMLEKQIYYQLVSFDDPPENVLRDFLNVRKKLIR